MSSTNCCVEVAASPEQLCYIPCSFCNIVLAVSVPCSSLFDIVTVRCGHCTNLWSVNMGIAAGFHHSASQNSSSHRHDQDLNDHPSSSKDLSVKPPPLSITNDQIINAPPEKRTRVPSAYNQFIKQEIQRIKASNPNISHREAFSAAAKNWAHFPHIHFGLMLEGNNHQAKIDEMGYMQGSKKRLKSTKESFNK